MRRVIPIALLLVALASAPAFADPGVEVRYEDEQLRVTLQGSYLGSYYRVWRSDELIGQYDYLASQLSLCTGDCFLTDQSATPGETYYYRFDIEQPNGAVISYGPYAVTVPVLPVAARLWPNPSKGAATLELSLPGSIRRDAPLPAEARLIDLQGRTVRMLYSGSLSRGLTTLRWDGRGDGGASLRAGIYFLRLETPIGSSTTRVLRIQ